jgi:hypothetical protein
MKEGFRGESESLFVLLETSRKLGRHWTDFPLLLGYCLHNHQKHVLITRS